METKTGRHTPTPIRAITMNHLGASFARKLPATALEIIMPIAKAISSKLRAIKVEARFEIDHIEHGSGTHCQGEGECQVHWTLCHRFAWLAYTLELAKTQKDEPIISPAAVNVIPQAR